jgi:plasmid stabilization system protein ParE
MSLPLAFRASARNEFDAAADWYELQRPGIGAKFTAAVEIVLDRIVEQPEYYAIVFEDVREGLVKGYPFCVYYRVRPSYINVIAVFHTSRDPAIWQERL